MKKLFKSKLFLQVIVASMVATLATVGIVGAVTTIGDNITTAGNLTVSGTAAITDASTLTGDLTVDTRVLKVDTSNDKVGVGTSTPYWLLQAAGTRPALTLSDTAASTDLKHWLLTSAGGNLYIGTSTDIYATSTPAALTVLNNGKVGIGTSTPRSALSVSTSAGVNPFMIGSSTATYLTVNMDGSLKVGSSSALFVNGLNNRVGIGSTTPMAALSVGTPTATTTIATGKFCMYVTDQKDRSYWITLNMGTASSSDTIFATTSVPCN
jgi:hypothetical protein